jgi:hypothetical protein
MTTVLGTTLSSSEVVLGDGCAEQKSVRWPPVPFSGHGSAAVRSLGDVELLASLDFPGRIFPGFPGGYSLRDEKKTESC